MLSLLFFLFHNLLISIKINIKLKALLVLLWTLHKHKQETQTWQISRVISCWDFELEENTKSLSSFQKLKLLSKLSQRKALRFLIFRIYAFLHPPNQRCQLNQNFDISFHWHHNQFLPHTTFHFPLIFYKQKTKKKYFLKRRWIIRLLGSILYLKRWIILKIKSRDEMEQIFRQFNCKLAQILKMKPENFCLV